MSNWRTWIVDLGLSIIAAMIVGGIAAALILYC